MKKAFSKSLSWLLSVAMLFGIFVVMDTANISVNAAYETPNYNSAVQSYSELQSRLETLKNKYVGTYWTTNGAAANSSGSTSKSYYGIQCNGFAKYIFNDLFCTGSIGTYDSNKYYFPNASGAILVDKSWNFSSSDTGTVKNILTRSDIGDFVQVRRRGKDYGHSMIITGKDDNGIWIFDCNSDGKCGVKSYYQDWSTFASKNVGMSLYHSTNYPPTVPMPSASYLNVAAGTHYTPTSFWWDQTENTDHYDLKIWRGTCWQGDAYRNVWRVTDTNCLVDLPEGYYEAYIDSVNSNGCTISRNIAQFTVGGGEKVDLGNDFYAYIIRNWNWSSLSDVNCNVQIQDGGNNVWHFTKTDDGGYFIKNISTGKYLDVTNALDTDCCNVQTCDFNGCPAQIWYVYGRWSGEYYLKPQCTSNKVLDIDTPSGNAQTCELTYRAVQQTFAIWQLEKTEFNYTISWT